MGLVGIDRFCFFGLFEKNRAESLKGKDLLEFFKNLEMIGSFEWGG